MKFAAQYGTLLAAAGLASIASSALAQTTGSIYVERVGDGSAALSSAGTAIFLDQFLTAGTLGTSGVASSLNLTNAGAKTVVDSGTAGSEGGLTQSGSFLTFAGYNAAVGTTGVSTGTATRGIGVYNVTTGTVDTTTALTDAFKTNNIRTATTADGANLYAAGTAGTGNTATAGVRFAADGATTTTALETSSTNTRYVGIANGNLYFSTGSAAGVGAVGVYQLGTGLPNAGSALPITPTAVAADTHLVSPYDFVFANNGSTLYVSDSTNGLVKYTTTTPFTGFTYAYSIAQANLTGLTFGGTDSAGNNVLYGVNGGAGTAGNLLLGIDDTGSTSTFATIATAPTNEGFRGVAFVSGPGPVPEPSGMAALLMGLGMMGLIIARRRLA